MFLEHLELKNFRNYRELSLDFDPAYNVLLGGNAQGKTNIVEAIYLASCARSHRTAKDKELILHGEDFYEIFLKFRRENGSEDSLRIRYEENNGRRSIFQGSFPLEKLADLFGIFHAVIFAPEDLMLIKNGPSERRRFLDILISQLSPQYFRQLQIYQKLLKQRNTMLKQLRDQNKHYQDSSVKEMRRLSLQIWDEQLAKSAAFILKKRAEITDELALYAKESLSHLSSEKEDLKLIYKPSQRLDLNESEEELSLSFAQHLSLQRNEDIQRGYTSLGPHRDDLFIFINGLEAQTYASQGQQRSIVLALKSAELKILEEHCSMKPVLLLDDVMSELDANRRDSLFQLILENQVFITTTEWQQAGNNTNLPKNSHAFFEVKNADVRKL